LVGRSFHLPVEMMMGGVFLFTEMGAFEFTDYTYLIFFKNG
jgi:hypothetical protein